MPDTLGRFEPEPAPLPRVLVIDDEAAIRYTLQLLLEDSGFAVTVASKGREGMAAFRANPTDLVLTDILMPEQEGIETILQIRGEYPQAKIIAMSGGGRIGNTDFLRMAEGLGADATIAKPFEIEALLDLMQSLLAPAPPAQTVP